MLKLNRNISVAGGIATLAIAGSFLGFTAGSNPALAKDTTTQFNVKIHVIPGCAAISTAPTDVNFGDFNGGDFTNWTLTTKQTSFNMTCTTGSDFTVALTPTNNSDTGGAGLMQMTGTGVTIGYQLCKKSENPCTSADAWGSQKGANTKSFTGTGAPQPVTVWAALKAPSAAPPAGTYTDVVQVAISPR
jgi:spore coat protein U-like protein